MDRDHHLQRGEHVHALVDNISGCIWRDKRLVSFLSTAYQATTTIAIQHRPNIPPYNIGTFIAHVAVQQCNNKNGVDRFASMLAQHERGLKTRMWVRVLWYVFDMAFVNAYILSTCFAYPHHHHRSIKHSSIALTEQLIGSRSYYKCLGRPRKIHLVPDQHFIQHAGRQKHRRVSSATPSHCIDANNVMSTCVCKLALNNTIHHNIVSLHIQCKSRAAASMPRCGRAGTAGLSKHTMMRHVLLSFIVPIVVLMRSIESSIND